MAAEAKAKRKKWKPSKDEVQAEMIRAHCTRAQALANLKAKAKTR